METLSKRLQYLLNYKGITPYILCKETGISQSTISRTLNEKGKPSRSNLIVISKYLNVNYTWLTTGNGQKEANEVENSPLLVEKNELIANDEFLLKSINNIIYELEKHQQYISEVKELKEAYELKADIITRLKKLKN